MSGYIVMPVLREPSDAEAVMTEVLRREYPTWEAQRADPMTQLRNAAAVLYSDAATLATRVAEEVFRYYGRSMVGLPPLDELAATGVARITAQDDDGPYVVPADLQFMGRNAVGEPVGFRVPAQAIIANGDTFMDVPVEATEEGAGSNDIGGSADFSEYVEYLTAVEFVGLTTGGRDREADDVYLDRLAEELALSTPTPVHPNDFAVLARRFGAWRATVIDGLDPVAGTFGHRATVTFAGVDAAGDPLAAIVRDFVATQLDAMRETGWRVFGIDPTPNPVDIAYEVIAYPDQDPIAVKAAIDGALASYLSGLEWGLRQNTGQSREWLNETTLRWSEVAGRIQRVEQVRALVDLGLSDAGDPPGGAGVDLALTGYVPIPVLDSVTGTVTV